MGMRQLVGSRRLSKWCSARGVGNWEEAVGVVRDIDSPFPSLS